MICRRGNSFALTNTIAMALKSKVLELYMSVLMLVIFLLCLAKCIRFIKIFEYDAGGICFTFVGQDAALF